MLGRLKKPTQTLRFLAQYLGFPFPTFFKL